MTTKYENNTSPHMTIFGYKALNRDFTDRNNKQYAIGEIYETNSPVEIFRSGFHFCELPQFVRDEYEHREDLRYIVIEILGTVVRKGIRVSATNSIRVLRELSYEELMADFVERHGEVCEHVLNSRRVYLKRGVLHRTSGPAVEHKSNGEYQWWKDGQLHSDDPNHPTVSYSSGTQKWYLHGILHRENGPAVIYPLMPGCMRRTKEWYIDDKLHRTNGPAGKYANGKQEWYCQGILHREDGPAVIHADGSKEWFEHGELHRIDGPARIMVEDREEWFYRGKRHRSDDEPAVTIMRQRDNGTIYPGTRQWWQHGALHRENGPAIVFYDGKSIWYKNGVMCEN